MNIYPQTENLLTQPVAGQLPNRSERFQPNLERPLYVKGEVLENILSLVMLLGLIALLFALAYAAAVVANNFELLLRSEGIAVM